MELRIRLVADGDAGAAAAAQSVATDLRRAGIEPVPQQVEAPAGSKSGAVAAIGQLVVTGVFSAATVAALAQIVVAVVQRGAARSVVLERNGERLEVTGLSARAQQQVIETFLAEDPE